MGEIMSDFGKFLSDAYKSADYIRIDGGPPFRIEKNGMVPFFASVVRELEKRPGGLWHIEACNRNDTTLWEYMGG